MSGGASSLASIPVVDPLHIPTAGVAADLQLYGARAGLLAGGGQEGAGLWSGTPGTTAGAVCGDELWRTVRG